MYVCFECSVRLEKPCVLFSLDPGGNALPDKCPWGVDKCRWMPLKDAPEETYDAVLKKLGPIAYTLMMEDL